MFAGIASVWRILLELGRNPRKNIVAFMVRCDRVIIQVHKARPAARPPGRRAGGQAGGRAGGRAGGLAGQRAGES